MQKLGRILTLVLALSIAFGPTWSMAAPMPMQQATMAAASHTVDHGVAPLTASSARQCQLCTGEPDTMPACSAPCLNVALPGPLDAVLMSLMGDSYIRLRHRMAAGRQSRPDPQPPRPILLT